MSGLDEVGVQETVGEFRKRKGTVQVNDTGRVTTASFANCTEQQEGRGYLKSINGIVPKKNVTAKATEAFLKKCKDSDIILEIYPTRFCSNDKCGKPSWNFKHFHEKGHSTCTCCGYVHRLVESNMDSRHLGEDEKANMSQWNCTPGCDVNDTAIITRKGKRVQLGGQRIPSHLRNYWSMRTDIDDIADAWQNRMHCIDSIAKSAKKKCKAFYYRVHSGQVSDDKDKMPHGRVQFAAACFYAAVLEFEQNRSVKTPCTLAAIQQSASECIIRRKNRNTRDVTVHVIIRYAKLLKYHKLCSALIPDITADTLRFASKHTGKEHTRLAIFNKCQPTNVRLPVGEPWGIDVGETGRGVLYIDNVTGGSAAFKAGVQKGDYIFQLENTVIGVEYTKESFGKLVGKIKRHRTDQPYIKVSIMREKK